MIVGGVFYLFEMWVVWDGKLQWKLNVLFIFGWFLWENGNGDEVDGELWVVVFPFYQSSRKSIKSLQPRSAINNLPLKSDSKSHQKFLKLITPNQSKLNFLNQKNMIKKPSVVDSEKS